MKIQIDNVLPFLKWTKKTTRNSVKQDLVAGITGAVIVLPQGVAFAAIAGLPPEYGLYTAIIAPVIAALFGSSHHLVSGPTTAISIIVFTGISALATPGTPEYISMVLTVTFMAGFFQFFFGLLRLGSILNFVCHSVIVGFTAGSAILVITSQIDSVTNLQLKHGSSFISTWSGLTSHLPEVNLYTVSIAITTIFFCMITKKLFPKAPNLLIGMIAGSVLASYLNNYTDTIKYIAEIPSQLPQLSAPTIDFSTIRQLLPQSLAIAIIGLVEASSISKSIATKSNQQLEQNQEFIGQGLANMIGSFFSCYAASGSFTRTGVNYSSGAKSPLSAIFAAVILLSIVLLIAPYTALLPTSAMAGIIFIVGLGLIDFKAIKEICSHHPKALASFLTTFLGTLFIDIEFAIFLGVLTSIFLFLRATSKPRLESIISIKDNRGKYHFVPEGPEHKTCPQLRIIRINSPIYFGSINHVQNHINATACKNIKHIILVVHGFNYIDLTGGEALITENKRLEDIGGGLYFVDHELSENISTGHNFLIKNIGDHRIFTSKSDAIDWVLPLLDDSSCHICKKNRANTNTNCSFHRSTD
ncbi:MAG: SulP family inorganic anion transporter [Desulfotalea sp.]